MKKTICLVLAALLLVLCACGSSSEQEPVPGLYVAEYAKLFGMKTDINKVFDGGFIVELREDGTGTASYNGLDVEITWTVLKDNTFRGEGEDFRLNGAVDKGVMVLENALDSGAYVVLRKGLPVPTAKPEAKTFDWWGGDWYGWWQMTDCTGIYEGMQLDRKDALCHLSPLSPAGRFSVTLWDEENAREDNLAEFELTVTDDGSTNGAAASGKGYFMNQNLKIGELTVTDQGQYADTMLIQGSYAVPNGSFRFTVMLRPWGASWDDAAAEDMPGHYSDWYLPLVERGARIPAVFDLDSAN